MFSLETWSLILKYSPAVEFPGKEFYRAESAEKLFQSSSSELGAPVCSDCIRFLAGLESKEQFLLVWTSCKSTVDSQQIRLAISVDGKEQEVGDQKSG